LVINIKIENCGDMFQFTEQSSGQIQNTVLVYSVSPHTMGLWNYTSWLCVCSFSFPASNVHMLYSHLWPLALQYFSTLPHKRHDFRKKREVIEHKTCVL